jgi:hypothetical protein
MIEERPSLRPVVSLTELVELVNHELDRIDLPAGAANDPAPPLLWQVELSDPSDPAVDVTVRVRSHSPAEALARAVAASHSWLESRTHIACIVSPEPSGDAPL